MHAHVCCVHVCIYACGGVHMCVGGNTPLNTELSAMVSLNRQLALGTYAPGSAGWVPHSPSLSGPLARVESTLTAGPLPQPVSASFTLQT